MRQPQTVLCVYACVLLYVECVLYIKKGGVVLQKQLLSLAATKQYTVKQQRYNDRRAPRSNLCGSSHRVCVCGWCTAAGDRITTVTRPMRQINTHRRTSYKVYETYSSSKSSILRSSYLYTSVDRVFLLDTDMTMGGRSSNEN